MKRRGDGAFPSPARVTARSFPLNHEGKRVYQELRGDRGKCFAAWPDNPQLPPEMYRRHPQFGDRDRVQLIFDGAPPVAQHPKRRTGSYSLGA